MLFRSKQNVMRRYVRRVHLRDVAGDRVRVMGEIRAIGLVAICVPLAGEDAFPTHRLKPQPHPADTGEQIDESEIGLQGSDIMLP